MTKCKIYRFYSNSSEPVFTGEYQGNRNLKSGATAIYNPDHKAWYASGYVVYQNDEVDTIIRKQQREHEYQSFKDKINNPNTAIGLMADVVSYSGAYLGYEGAVKAVTIGQTVPKLVENQDQYDTFTGKLSASVTDLTNEAAKASITTAIVSLAGAAIVEKQINSLNRKPSFTDGLILTGTVGFSVNNTIGKYTDE